MEKLKSSMKTFQESISPICLQEGRTLSFREILEYNSASAGNSTTSSSSSPTSSPECKTDNNNNNNNITVPDSERFFFSPHKTKDIMEESTKYSERKFRSTISKPAELLSFSDGSTTVAVESYNPYRDFRKSMEEMVAVHRLREWPQLQELLHCYLRLNDKNTHQVIVIAFVDLLMHMISRDSEGLYDSLPLTFCLDML